METFQLAMSANALLQQSVLIVGLAITLPFTVLWFACETADECARNGGCTRVYFESSRFLPRCNFKRVPGLIGALEYIDNLQSNSSENLDTSLRSYCSPGERLETRQETDEECMPRYTYPNSINHEIADLDAVSHSQRMCGAWIDAGSAPDAFSATYWSFSGMDREADAVRAASLLTMSSSPSRTNIGKMVKKCTHTTLAGDVAILASTKDAYTHLVSEAGIDGVTDTNSALTSLGVLAGHYCDAPISIGWTYSSSSAIGAFAASMNAGARFSDTAMGEALQMVGEPNPVIEAAVDANSRVNSAADVAMGYPLLATLERVYEGASGRTDHERVSLQYGYANELIGFKILSEEDTNAAKHYLKGVAATCSFVVGSSLGYVGYNALPSWSASQRDLVQRRNAKTTISALGRMKRSTNHNSEPMQEVDNAVMHNASSATFSQLVSSEFVSADEQCSAYTSALFPDTLDAERFSIIYSDNLYQKLELITSRAQKGVAAVQREDDRIRRVLSDPDKVAADVEKVRLRIPGAPRSSWAGANRDLPLAVFESKDSFFKMVLKQARAVFLDRQDKLVYEANHVCEGPPVMDSLTANAYIYPNVHCSYYLLGLSLRPFLDSSFDEESILSRYAYIVAHEFAHSTLNTEWITSELELLLHRYDPTTYSEAIADVVAGLGLMRSNADSVYQLDAQNLCDHVAQTWCARVGSLYYMPSSGGVHPRANKRGDFFCDTLLVDLNLNDL